MPTPTAPAKANNADGLRWPWAIALFLIFFVCIALAFLGGYFLQSRHDRSQFPSPVNTPPPAQGWKPPLPSEAPPRAVIVDEPDELLGPRATLDAFLSASGWAARSAYVLDPNRVAPQLENRAREHGDGPIAVTSVSLSQANQDSHIFRVQTEKIPEGFFAAVLRRGNNWQVDSETFFEFHDDEFRDFVEKRTAQAATFHLLVKPADEEAANELFATYRLTPPIPGRSFLAFVRRDSVANASLRAIFEGTTEFDPETLARLTAKEGVPLTLRVICKPTTESEPNLHIEQVIATGWDS